MSIVKTTAALYAAAASLTILAAAPADAASQSCWIVPRGGRSVPSFRCDVSLRTNANGHKVVDITHFQGNGARFSVVLWTDDYNRPTTAEVFVNGERFRTAWYRDSDGDVRLDMGNHGTFVF